MRWLSYFTVLKKRIGSQVFWTIFLAIAFSIFAIAFTNFLINRIAEANQKTIATTNDLFVIYQIRNVIPAAESAQRAYLLTHQKEHLTPFEYNVALAQTLYQKLALSPSLKSAQEKALMVNLLAAINSKITEMRLTVSLQEQREFKQALNLTKLAQSLSDMKNIHAIQDTLIALERNKLDEYREVRDEKIRWARALIISTIVVLMMVLATSFRAIIGQIIEKDKIREQLAIENDFNEKKLTETTRQLHTLALDAQGDIERERNKLARELHDELGSILTATKMDLSWVMKKTKENAPEVQEKIGRTIQYLDQGIQFKRQIVEALHPSMISTFGLWPAIKNLVEDSAERNGWALTLTMPEEPLALNNSLGLIAYRVIQETLNNASKYAKATEVTLEILTSDTQIKIEIVDNGVGVDLASIDPSTHGLSGMKHRIEAIGGRINVESSPSKGMFTRVMLPI